MARQSPTSNWWVCSPTVTSIWPDSTHTCWWTATSRSRDLTRVCASRRAGVLSSPLCDDLAMIIVSGRIYVDEADRASYLQESRQVIVAARVWDGCIDFHLAADPIEPDRINVYEQWRSVEAVEAFRGAGPSSEQMAAIRDASVFQHEVASSTKL